MIKKELKNNFKSFIIWGSIIIIMLLIVFLIYPSISKDMSKIDEMMNMFPKEMLKAFNMDIVSISTVSGWILTEGYIFIAIICACFSSLMASNILVNEESDKTIEFLYAMPISKNKIITNKILVSLIYIFGLNIIIFLINLIGLKLSNDLNMIQCLNISIGTLSISLIFYFLTLFISVFYKNIKKTLGISLALSLGTYILKLITDISDKLNILKYFTPYEYFSARSIIVNNGFELKYIIISIFMVIISIIGTYYFYNKKEYL